MRFLSNACLSLATVLRFSNRASCFFIEAAVAARKFELRLKPDLELDAWCAKQRFNEALHAAVQSVLTPLPFNYPPRACTIVPPARFRSYDAREDDERVSRARSLTQDIRWGSEEAKKVALIAWAEEFPDDPLPEKPAEAFLPSFERTTLNGKFRVTAPLRAKIKAIKKTRPKDDLLVVVNKTNTAIAIGFGQLGDMGGLLIPVSDEPFVLTDHYSRSTWTDSSDFRRAVAKDWLAVVAC